MTYTTRAAVAAITATTLTFATIIPVYAQGMESADLFDPDSNNLEINPKCITVPPGKPLTVSFRLHPSTFSHASTLTDKDAAVASFKKALLGNTEWNDTNDTKKEDFKEDLNLMVSLGFTEEDVKNATIEYDQNYLKLTFKGPVINDANAKKLYGKTVRIILVPGITAEDKDGQHFPVRSEGVDDSISTFHFSVCTPPTSPEKPQPKKPKPLRPQTINGDDSTGKIVGGIIGSFLGLTLLALLLRKLMPQPAPTTTSPAPKTPVKGIVKGVEKGIGK